jgi:hypothetical protein
MRKGEIPVAVRRSVVEVRPVLWRFVEACDRRRSMGVSTLGVRAC